jgi:hypothetical protein
MEGVELGQQKCCHSIYSLPTFRLARRRKSDQESQCESIKHRKGAWSKEECYIFLFGVHSFGYGSWKEIGLILPTRY